MLPIFVRIPKIANGHAHNPRKFRFVSILWWLLLAALAGGLYGYLRSVLTPTSVNELSGRTIVAEAVVKNTYPFSGGRVIDLTITDLRVNGEPGHHRVHVAAVWFARGQASLPSLGSGTDVELNGILTTLPRTTNANNQTYMLAAGPTYQFIGQFQEVIAPALGRASSAPGLIQRVRENLEQDVRVGLGPGLDEDSQLLQSIVFGNGDLTDQMKQSFLSAGLLHVLAASGANVLLLQKALELTGFRLWRILRLPYWMWIWLMVVFVWFFAGLCDFAPSIVRAATMASYALIGKLLQRSAATSSALRMTALQESLWDPALLASVGSVLSFVATAAVANALLMREPRRPFTRSRPWQRLKGWLMQGLLTSLWVDLYLIPITMAFFAQVTPYSIISNLVAEPLLTLLLPVAALFMALSSLHALGQPIPVLMHWTGWLSLTLLHLLTAVTSRIASWPFALLELRLPSLWWAAFYYAVILLHQNNDKKFVKK